MKQEYIRLLSVLLYISVFTVSCHGKRSTEPPVMPIQNMVTQSSYSPQAPDDFFEDKRATREPVPHTVAEGEANNDVRYFKGQEPGSTVNSPKWVSQFPLKLNMSILKDGQKNFNIYCAPCHGRSGHNDGLVTQRAGGSIRPAEIHSPDVKNMPVGRIYYGVTEGVNNWNMPGFAAQLNAKERWAVVAYVRALQASEQTQKTETSSSDVQQKKGEKK